MRKELKMLVIATSPSDPPIKLSLAQVIADFIYIETFEMHLFDNDMQELVSLGRRMATNTQTEIRDQFRSEEVFFVHDANQWLLEIYVGRNVLRREIDDFLEIFVIRTFLRVVDLR
jgi:hypothetical protein